MFYETLRFWAEVLRPYQEQQWTLPNTVTFENDSLRLRRFSASDGGKVPILILAPNAGHHQNISEPLIRRCLGVDPGRPVYVVDWTPPTPYSRNRFDSMNDIAANITACVRRLGNRVHLFTLCQGAWAGAMYAALRPDTVVSYVNAAGPIDFGAGEGKILDICQKLPMSFYKNMVTLGGGVQKGEYQLFGFKSLNPYDRYVADYMDLWFAVCEWDEDKIMKWRRFKEWYDQPVDLAGVWYLEAVDRLFKKNQLIKGELEILGERVDLKNIRCPVFLIAGDRDDITPPAQVFHMADYVSGTTRTKLIENAGHIGVFVKESSLKYWEEAILKDLDIIDRQAGITAGPAAVS